MCFGFSEKPFSLEHVHALFTVIAHSETNEILPPSQKIIETKTFYFLSATSVKLKKVKFL